MLGELLENHFGHDVFRPGQREVIERVLAGRPVLAVFPTGGGKSLCYQLPALALGGLTLVVSPLIALMRDQVDALTARGIAACRLDSTLDAAAEAAVRERLDAGEVSLLYVAPERFANEGFRRDLRRWAPRLAAIDEAHCIAEWGHNFRPDYLKLAAVLRRMRVPRVLALTATATVPVAREIRRFFRIAAGDEVRLPFGRPNLSLHVTPCADGDRLPVLRQRLENSAGAHVVYVTRQETAESVATNLARHGIPARAYHAGLRADFRARAQQAFMDGETRVIVATIAFGMGIDKGDIRGVIHYNLPKSPENLVQETGRAGRDGQPARCEILACADDMTVLENFIHGDVPGDRALAAMLDRLLRLGRTFDISHYEFSRVCDIRQGVLATVLAYLENDGVLVPLGRHHAGWRVRLLRPLESVLAGRGAAEVTRLRKCLSSAVSRRGWLEIEASTSGVGDPAGLLGGLHAAGDAVVRPRGVRHRYRLRAGEIDRRAIVAAITARFGRRESDDLARLGMVLDYVNHDGCLTAWLAGYFGCPETTPCGNCDRCHGVRAAAIERPPARMVGDDEWARAAALAARRHPQLATPRQLARFLCGMTSPASRAVRLQQDECFGMLADVPFADVHVLAQAWLGG